ncbi:GSDMA protein, partial [Hippolais icterina]|nr:GSDMA protein [Hippolais icterina]
RMIKNLTKFIINEMDPSKGFVPVESIADNEHFRPLCLLIKNRKLKRIFHRAPYYQQTEFTLDDVLLPGEDGQHIESLLQDSSPFTLTKSSVDQVDGGLNISLDPATLGLQGGAFLSCVFSIKPKKKSISWKSLVALREREINVDHSFIQQLWTTGTSLYMVTDILEASEEAVYKESTKADGGFMARFYATLSAQGTRENNQGIVIPKGCTLAFRTILLCIRHGTWRKTQVTDGVSFWFAGSSKGKLGEVVEEVKKSCQFFSKLSPDLLLIIFNTIKAVMRDRNLLQELSQKMEEIPEQNDGCKLKTESPDLKDLLSKLQHSPRDHLLLLAEGI